MATPPGGSGTHQEIDMAQDFQGILYDILDEVIVERSPVIRGSYAEAEADARVLAAGSGGRYDKGYCFVIVDNEIAY